MAGPAGFSHQASSCEVSNVLALNVWNLPGPHSSLIRYTLALVGKELQPVKGTGKGRMVHNIHAPGPLIPCPDAEPGIHQFCTFDIRNALPP